MRITNTHCALLIFLIVLGLRCFHLSDAALWEDEAFRYDLALGDRTHFVASRQETSQVYTHTPDVQQPHGSLADVLSFLRAESPYAPGYYTILHVFMVWGVRSVAALSLVNALCAAGTATVLFLLGRRFLPVSSALVAPLLFMLSAWDVGVNMQLKETGMATMLGWLGTLLLQRLLGDPKGWVAYGVCLGCALLVQQQSIYWFPVHGLWVVLDRRHDGVRLIALSKAWIVSATMYLPWFLYAGQSQLSHLRAVNHLFGGDWADLAGVVGAVHIYIGQSLAPLGPATFREAWALASFVGLVLVVCGHGVIRHRHRAVILGSTVWLGGLLLAMLTYIIMRQNQALWPRYSPIFLPGAWLVTGGLLHLASQVLYLRRSIANILVPISAVTLGVVLFPRPLEPVTLDRYTDWRPVATALETRASPGDLVVHQVGYNAFDAFIHLWPLATQHRMMSAPSPEQREALRAYAEGRPVWFVLSWGHTGDGANWQSTFADRQMIEVNIPETRSDNLASSSGSGPAAVRVVGFIPQ